jgi:hypothetical protein
VNLPLVLDVVVSLVFIYLVLSLLASEFQELVATVLQWRARHLKDSITNLLAGPTAGKPQFKVIELVNDLYTDPLIADMNQEARGFLARSMRGLTRWLPGNRRGDFGHDQSSGPSYIPAATFATALTERLGVTSLVNSLIEIRLNAFIERIVGKGIPEIAAQFDVELSQDIYFRSLTQDCEGLMRDYQSGYADLNTSVARLSEAIDRYVICDADNPEKSYYLDRVRAFKLSLFGSNNDRVMRSAGLQPTMEEVAGLVNKSSGVHKELSSRYANLQDQAGGIPQYVREQAQIRREQSGDETLALDPFIDQVLDELTDEEFRTYRDYQAYRKAVQVIELLPESVQNSMAVLSRRAQSKIGQTSTSIELFQTEVAHWFDGSMSRSSGVYKRNAKGIALIIGFMIAAFSNADTFHILNRLSSDDSLRKVVTDRASELRQASSIDTNQTLRPGEIARQLESLKNQTDEVLSDMPLPVTWNPSNLSRQLGCPYTPTMSLTANKDGKLPYALLTREQWYVLYRSCLNQPDAPVTAPIWMQVLQMINVKPFAFLRMLFGWFLSGIAIAMGAPFWFDLLSRLMNVRNTGSKPSSTSIE